MLLSEKLSLVECYYLSSEQAGIIQCRMVASLPLWKNVSLCWCPLSKLKWRETFMAKMSTFVCAKLFEAGSENIENCLHSLVLDSTCLADGRSPVSGWRNVRVRDERPTDLSPRHCSAELHRHSPSNKHIERRRLCKFLPTTLGSQVMSMVPILL